MNGFTIYKNILPQGKACSIRACECTRKCCTWITFSKTIRAKCLTVIKVKIKLKLCSCSFPASLSPPSPLSLRLYKAINQTPPPESSIFKRWTHNFVFLDVSNFTIKCLRATLNHKNQLKYKYKLCRKYMFVDTFPRYVSGKRKTQALYPT